MTTDNGAVLGQGNIQVKLGTEVIELKPSVWAFQTISRQFGGLQGALERVQRFDAEAIHEIIVAGAGSRYNNTKARQSLMEKMFVAGLGGVETDEVAEKAMRYIVLLMRGGRPPPVTDDNEADAGGETEPKNARSSS